MRTSTDSQATTTIHGIDVTAIANATMLVGAVAYTLCALVAAFAPDLYLGFFQSWFHGISLAPLRAGGPALELVGFITGLVTFGVSVWLVTAAIAVLYNRLAR